MKRTVSVVVLSFNRPNYLQESLTSITAQTLLPVEVIVVDNRSVRSKEVRAVVAEFPAVRLIANPTNQGFTGGMNTGLRAATGEYVVLSEDDIVLAPGAVEALVCRLDSQPNVGLVGGLMLNRGDGTVRAAGGWIRLAKRFEMTLIGAGAADEGQFEEPFPVGYLPGAFLAGRRSVWERLGGFRERYFLYMEDVDLCVRAATAGLRIEVVPSSRVWHFDPPVDGRPPDWLSVLKLRNLLRLYLLNAPVRILPAFVARYYIWRSISELFRGRRSGWQVAEAFARTLLELPFLLKERVAKATLRSEIHDESIRAVRKL